jgi:prepilin-type processing-associated H-X9-DG protein
MADFNRKGPSQLWVMMDEHPDTILGSEFSVSMLQQNMVWGALPASYHNGGATMFFGDGHAEFKKWLLPETKQPVRFKYVRGYLPSNKDPRDLEWVRDHTTEPEALE